MFAVCTVSVNSAISYPAVVFQKLREIGDLVANYKIFKEEDASLGRFVEIFQQMNPLIAKDVFNETVEVITQNIEKLAALDSSIRNVLLAEKQNSCILSLLTFLDQITTQSGFLVSNCIEITDPAVFHKTSEYYNNLKETIKQIEKLPLVMFNPFVGRNVFTQSDEIAARIQELYDIELSDDQETLDGLLEKINIFALAWHNEYFSIKSCLGEVEGNLKDAHAAIQAQLLQCKAFGGKTGRSFQKTLDFADYFL